MQKRSLLSSVFFLGSLSLVSGIVGAPSSAQAGFQWVSPAPAAAQQAPVVVPPTAQPAPAYNPLIIDAPRSAPVAPEPLIIAPPAPAPAARPMPNLMPPEAMAPALQPPAGAAPMSVLAPPAPSAEAEKPVQGFANKVPLTVALRQILPPDYGFTLSSDVESGKLVSWRGGRAWRSVLQDMLQDSGLTMQDQGGKILVARASAPVPAPTVGAAPAPSPSSSHSLGTLPELPPLAPLPPLSPPPSTMPQNVLPNFDVPAAPAAQAGEPMVETWVANRGETLRTVLEDWTRRANVELSWQAEYDYPLQASVTLAGSFEEAARNLLVGFQEANPQPIARLHNNPAAGKPVMVVQARGNNYTE